MAEVWKFLVVVSVIMSVISTVLVAWMYKRVKVLTIIEVLAKEIRRKRMEEGVKAVIRAREKNEKN